MDHARIDGQSQGYPPSTSANGPDDARKAVDTNPIGPTIGPIDPLDAALARALSAAVDASRLDLVASIVEELRMRRIAATKNVLEINARTYTK